MIRTLASRLPHFKSMQKVSQSALVRRAAAAFLLLMVSVEQATAQVLASNMGTAICKFKDSGIVPIIAAVAIIAIAVMLILNEGKGLGGWVVRIIIGVAIILEIGVVVTWLVPSGTLGC